MPLLNEQIGCTNRLPHTCSSSIIASTQVGLQSKSVVTCRMMLGNVGASATAMATKARYGQASEVAWQTSLAARRACTSRTAPFLGSSLKAAGIMIRFQVSTHTVKPHAPLLLCMMLFHLPPALASPRRSSVFSVCPSPLTYRAGSSCYNPRQAALLIHTVVIC